MRIPRPQLKKSPARPQARRTFLSPAIAHEAGNDAQALAYLTKALRLNQSNSEAAAFTCMLLIQDAWALPVAILPAGSLTLHDKIFGFDSVKVFAHFSPDGQRLLTASDDGTARVWDARTGQALGEPMEHPVSANSAQFSPGWATGIHDLRGKLDASLECGDWKSYWRADEA